MFISRIRYERLVLKNEMLTERLRSIKNQENLNLYWEGRYDELKNKYNQEEGQID